MKKRIQDIFFEMVRAGLWEKNGQLAVDDWPFCEPTEWKEVYRLASEQGVLGLVLAGIEQLSREQRPPQELLLQWIGTVQIIELQNRTMNEFVVQLMTKLQNNDIHSLLVKGQGVAQCYEKPLWRTIGDVDLLLDDENYEKAKKSLCKIADDIAREDISTKHQAMTINGVEVELHGMMPFLLSRRVEKVLNEVVSDANKNCTYCTSIGDGVSVPRVDEHVVIVFTHFLHHFFIEGVGLRQICDWCRMLWVYKDLLDYELLEQRINQMGLMTEWKAFGALAVNWLGMPKEAMPFYDSRFTEKASRIVKLVMKAGNFGHNKDLSYRTKYSGGVYKVVALWRRLVDFCRFKIIFPVDAPRFFITYVVNKV